MANPRVWVLMFVWMTITKDSAKFSIFGLKGGKIRLNGTQTGLIRDGKS